MVGTIRTMVEKVMNNSKCPMQFPRKYSQNCKIQKHCNTNEKCFDEFHTGPKNRSEEHQWDWTQVKRNFQGRNEKKTEWGSVDKITKMSYEKFSKGASWKDGVPEGREQMEQTKPITNGQRLLKLWQTTNCIFWMPREHQPGLILKFLWGIWYSDIRDINTKF